MTHFTVRAIALAAITVSLAGTGCRDAGSVVQSVGQPAPRSVTPATSVALNGANAVVTLALDLRGDVGKIGSFTGRLRFDAAAMTYAGENGFDDGTLRAVNAGPGEIRVAAASASGINPGALASLRFVTTDSTALQRVTFEVEELHEVSRTDLKAIVRGTAPRRFQ